MNVTFVSFPTVDARPMADGTRFLDNTAVDGSIPQMVEGVWVALSRNITRRAVVNDLGREDIWEYPPRAVRELVANALMHRDYHPLAQGSQIRVELYPDRFKIISPGGLYGVVNAEELQHSSITSTRNLVLSRLLEDVVMPNSEHTVAENRGTGLFVVASELERAGLPSLDIKTNLLSFTATIRQSITKTNQETFTKTAPITSRQSEILKLLDGQPKSTQELASVLGITRPAVQQHLRNLESAGMVSSTTKSRHSPGVRWQKIYDVTHSDTQ
jgi:ATP-dependent DNA helicase RecG